VRVTLGRDGELIVLEVVDDGVGYDTAISVGGLGLRNMRERAFNAGGRLEVVSSPGSGTRVQMRIPARARVIA